MRRISSILIVFSMCLVASAQIKPYMAAGFQSLMIKDDGSLWAWGDNEFGQLGDGTKTDRTTPIKIMDDVAQVAAGYDYTLAIKNDGSLWAWGKNEFGQLGDGTKTGRTTPVKIMNDVAKVAAGEYCTLAIKSDGSMWAWGANGFNQFGDGTGIDSTTPVKIMNNVAQVAVGKMHSLAIKSDGSLWAWGDNFYDQLGDGTSIYHRTPVKIMDDVAQVSAGFSHNFAIKSDGSLWAWGENKCGRLGDGTTTTRKIPIKIMDDVAQVSAGFFHTIAIKSDGSLWAWGENYGKFGDGTKTDSTTPVKIMDDVIQVAAGGSHTLAIKSDGSLWAWGDNFTGQLGDGTRSDSSTPIYITTTRTTPTTVTLDLGVVIYELNTSDRTAKILRVGTTEGGDIVIPGNISYEGNSYNVTSVGDSIFCQEFYEYSERNEAFTYSCTFPSTITAVSEKAFIFDMEFDPSAIVWESNAKLPDFSFDDEDILFGNFLLYVNSANIAPSNVANVVVDGTANEIRLRDGHVFHCPMEFVAKKISYTHNYMMQTGLGDCAGWETIALPFDVQTITHETKGELIPFAQYNSASNKKPFWLYSIKGYGFGKDSSIKANTPYLISMPNNSSYDSNYNVAGNVTFSANNVNVEQSAHLDRSILFINLYFQPCYTFRYKHKSGFALNISNDNCTYSGEEKPGSIFINNYRTIYPFEAYFYRNDLLYSKLTIPFADDEYATSVNDVLLRDDTDAVYSGMVQIINASGQVVMTVERNRVNDILHLLKNGVYLVDGRKILVEH